MRTLMLFIFVFISILLAGCATSRINQLQRDNSTCAENIRNQHPLAVEIENKYGIGPNPPTLKQRLGNNQLTEEEKEAYLSLWVDMESTCMTPFLAKLNAISPERAAIISRHYNLAGEVAISLLKNGITTQEASKSFRNLASSVQSEIIYQQRLKDQQTANLINSFAEGFERGRVQRAKSQPTTINTTCTKFMRTVNCTSR